MPARKTHFIHFGAFLLFRFMLSLHLIKGHFGERGRQAGQHVYRVHGSRYNTCKSPNHLSFCPLVQPCKLHHLLMSVSSYVFSIVVDWLFPMGFSLWVSFVFLFFSLPPSPHPPKHLLSSFRVSFIYMNRPYVSMGLCALPICWLTHAGWLNWATLVCLLSRKASRTIRQMWCQWLPNAQVSRRMFD